MLDREDVARWIDGLASGGDLSRRSVEVCRTLLRAALADAVEEGLIKRSPAARVGMPRDVAKPPKEKEAVVWTEAEVARFLEVIDGHRFVVALRLGVLYGLRRSEALALRWDDLDTEAGTIRVDEGLVPVNKGTVWTDTKTHRSRGRSLSTRRR